MKKIFHLLSIIILLVQIFFIFDYSKVAASEEECKKNYSISHFTTIRLNMKIDTYYDTFTVTYTDGDDRKVEKEIAYQYLPFPEFSTSIDRITSFKFRLEDRQKNIVKEWTEEVSPFPATQLKTTSNYLTGKTSAETSVHLSYEKLVNGKWETINERDSSNTGGDFKFPFSYTEIEKSIRDYPKLELHKDEDNWTKTVKLNFSPDKLDGTEPTLMNIRNEFSEDEKGMSITSIDDWIATADFQYLDKDKNVLFETHEENLRTYYILTRTQYPNLTFKENGIKYIRYKIGNQTGCSTPWYETVVKDITPPKTQWNPIMREDKVISGITEVGTDITWKQKDKSGRVKVSEEGNFIVNLPFSVAQHKPKINLKDSVGNSFTVSNFSFISRIDDFSINTDLTRFAVRSKYPVGTKDEYIDGMTNYSLRINGKEIVGRRIIDGYIDFSDDGKLSLPAKVNFSFLNLDGTKKYSIEKTIVNPYTPKFLENVRYDLDKQTITAEAPLFHNIGLYDQKTNWVTSIYATEKNVVLAMSDKKKIIKVGDTLLLSVTIPGEKGLDEKLKIKQTKIFKIPHVEEITIKSRYIEGKTIPNATVYGTLDKKSYEGKSNKSGIFKIKISSPKAGTQFHIKAIDHLNQKTPIASTKVLSVFNTFTTSKIKSLSTVVKGKGHGGAEIKILNGKKIIGKSLVNKNGEYLVKISKQKKNTVLRIEMKKQGFQTSYKNVKVH